MKYLYLTLLLFFTIQINAQVEQEIRVQDNNLYNTAAVDKIPEFPGGMNEFYKYISRNYTLPNVKGLKGKVFVTFVVEVDGRLSDFKILKDLGYGTGEEAIRVLELSPTWTSGEQNGKKVRVQYALPISLSTN